MIAVASQTELREATHADLPRLVEMFTEFVSSTQYAQYVGNNPEISAGMIARMIGADDCAVFVADSPNGIIGMLGLLIFMHPFSGECVSSELFWWLDPKHRGPGVWLLRRGERWARSKGATRMTMMAPKDNQRVADIYQVVGYHEVERLFQKDL